MCVEEVQSLELPKKNIMKTASN